VYTSPFGSLKTPFLKTRSVPSSASSVRTLRPLSVMCACVTRATAASTSGGLPVFWSVSVSSASRFAAPSSPPFSASFAMIGARPSAMVVSKLTALSVAALVDEPVPVSFSDSATSAAVGARPPPAPAEDDASAAEAAADAVALPAPAAAPPGSLLVTGASSALTSTPASAACCCGAAASAPSPLPGGDASDAIGARGGLPPPAAPGAALELPSTAAATAERGPVPPKATSEACGAMAAAERGFDDIVRPARRAVTCACARASPSEEQQPRARVLRRRRGNNLWRRSGPKRRCGQQLAQVAVGHPSSKDE
jgi:hypothetical protein